MIASDLLNDTVKKIVADNKKSNEQLNEKYDAHTFGDYVHTFGDRAANSENIIYMISLN